MSEFLIYIDMVERVSSLPKYYVCIRRASTACMHVTAKTRLIFAYILIKINSCYDIFTIIHYFLIEF